MILTIDYLKKEAEGIQAAWNGEDARFNYEGDVFNEEDVQAAQELEEKLVEVVKLAKELGLA